MALTQKTVFSTALTLVIVLLIVFVPGQVTGDGKPSKPDGDLSMSSANGNSPTTDDIKVSGPFTITTGGMQEATVAVIPPNKFQRCPDGRLIFGSGNFLRSVSLTPGSGHAPFTVDLLPSMRHPTDLATPYIIDDNHITAFNDFLDYTVEGVIWRDDISPHPSWWNDTKTYPLKGLSVPGGRSAIFFFKSNTCGETWTLSSVLDAAKLEVRNPLTQKMEVGYCGVPRINLTTKTSSAGGWDGHYLYKDVSGPAYYLITTKCASGKGQTPGLLVISSNGYPDWRVLRQYDNAENFWRMPIAQLYNQTLAVAYQQNGNLIIDVNRYPYTSPDYDYKPIATIPVSWPARLNMANIGLNASMYAYYNLATTTVLEVTGKPKEGFIIVSYMNDNDDAIYNLYFRAPDAGPGPLKPFATIRAATKGRNPLHGTLVQSAKPGVSSIFYWVEEVFKGQFQMRFQLFNQMAPVGAPRNISGTFTTPAFTGDYLGGTSYYASDGTHYFLSWNESNTLKYVEVLVPHSLAP